MKFSEDNAIQIFKDEVMYRKYKSGIYFLVDENNEVVYIGQARNLDTRPFEHRDKEFSKIFAIPIHRDNLSDNEFIYIVKYLPTYNKSLPRSSDYLSFSMLRSHSHSSISNEKILEILNKKKINYLEVKLPSKRFAFYYIHISNLIRVLNAIRPIEKPDLHTITLDLGRKNRITIHPTILNSLGWNKKESFNISFENCQILITQKGE